MTKGKKEQMFFERSVPLIKNICFFCPFGLLYPFSDRLLSRRAVDQVDIEGYVDGAGHDGGYERACPFAMVVAQGDDGRYQHQRANP